MHRVAEKGLTSQIVSLSVFFQQYKDSKEKPSKELSDNSFVISFYLRSASEHRLEFPPLLRLAQFCWFPCPLHPVGLTPSVSTAVHTNHLPRGVEWEPETDGSCRSSAVFRGLE